MPLETKCRACSGSGKGIRYTESGWADVPCETCRGSGVVAPYRVKPAMWDVDHKVNSWPRFGRDGHCTVCDKPLAGRQKVFCGNRECKRLHFFRVYHGVHWQKRHVIVRDGCMCNGCGDEFMSPLVEGGPLYPMPHMLELDHIVPLADGGSEDESNLQVLCRKCHKEKTAREAGPRFVRKRMSSQPALSSSD